MALKGGLDGKGAPEPNDAPSGYSLAVKALLKAIKTGDDKQAAAALRAALAEADGDD